MAEAATENTTIGDYSWLASVPGSRLPALVQTLLWLASPKQYIDRCRARYGKTFSIDVLGWGRLVMTSDPALVRESLTNRTGHYSVAAANKILTPVVGANSVFVRDGADHAEARAQMRAPFMPAAVDGYRPMLFDLAERFSDRIAALPKDLREEIRLYCMSAMTYVCFGRSDLASAREAVRKIAPILGPVTSTFAFLPALHTDFGPLSPVRYVKFRLRRFDDMLALWTDEAIAAGHACLATTIAQREGVTHCNAVIRDQVATALIAGFEATAAAVEWVLFWIHRDPELTAAIKAEVCGAEQGEEGIGSSLEIDGPLLDSVCKEALRLTPPVDFYPRQLRTGPGDENVVLVAPCSLTMHREADVFPEPDQFCPARFRDNKFSNHQYSVYGGGEWRCPGEGLSQIALKALVATLIARYEIGLGTTGAPQWRRKTIVLIPKSLKITSIRKR